MHPVGTSASLLALQTTKAVGCRLFDEAKADHCLDPGLGGCGGI